MCFIISNYLYTAHHNLLGMYMYVISPKSVACVGLLISEPSVFVWGPEACLSMVFMENVPSTKENRTGGSKICTHDDGNTVHVHRMGFKPGLSGY